MVWKVTQPTFESTRDSFSYNTIVQPSKANVESIQLSPAFSKMNAPELASLAHQVAGHPGGVQTLSGGQFVVKDCLERELSFYQEIQTAAESEEFDETQKQLVKRLITIIPTCKGSWTEYTNGLRTESDNSDAPPRIVLENLTFGFEQPNVCDIKLGTQLWDEEASQEKRLRMDLAAQSTTSGSHGIRLTGWQVSSRRSSARIAK